MPNSPLVQRKETLAAFALVVAENRTHRTTKRGSKSDGSSSPRRTRTNPQTRLGAGTRNTADPGIARDRAGSPGGARSGLSQGYLSQIEAGSWTAVTEEAFGRIATALGVEPWMILAQAAGLKLDQVERFTEDERVWLDTYRALDPEQRETILRVAMVMRRPAPRKRSS